VPGCVQEAKSPLSVAPGTQRENTEDSEKKARCEAASCFPLIRQGERQASPQIRPHVC